MMMINITSSGEATPAENTPELSSMAVGAIISLKELLSKDQEGQFVCADQRKYRLEMTPNKGITAHLQGQVKHLRVGLCPHTQASNLKPKHSNGDADDSNWLIIGAFTSLIAAGILNYVSQSVEEGSFEATCCWAATGSVLAIATFLFCYKMGQSDGREARRQHELSDSNQMS